MTNRVRSPVAFFYHFWVATFALYFFDKLGEYMQ